MKSAGITVGVLSLLFLSSLSAHAADITVKAREYSANQCGYASNTLADLAIAYTNTDLPSGTRVRLHYAFHDEYSGSNWTHSAIADMSPVGPHMWESDFNAFVVGSRGYFGYDKLQTVYEIIRPDGTTTFDNGGLEAFGHYTTSLSSLNFSCRRPDNMATLTTKPARAQD